MLRLSQSIAPAEKHVVRERAPAFSAGALKVDSGEHCCTSFAVGPLKHRFEETSNSDDGHRCKLWSEIDLLDFSAREKESRP